MYAQLRQNSTYAVEQQVDDCRLEYVAQGDPIQEPQEGLQSGLNKGSLLCLFQNLRAQFEDL